MPKCKLLKKEAKDCFDRLYHTNNKEDKDDKETSIVSFLSDDTIFIEKMNYEKNSFDICVKKLDYYLRKCDY